MTATAGTPGRWRRNWTVTDISILSFRVPLLSGPFRSPPSYLTSGKSTKKKTETALGYRKKTQQSRYANTIDVETARMLSSPKGVPHRDGPRYLSRDRHCIFAKPSLQRHKCVFGEAKIKFKKKKRAGARTYNERNKQTEKKSQNAKIESAFSQPARDYAQ